jgi:hypothetical protein
MRDSSMLHHGPARRRWGRARPADHAARRHVAGAGGGAIHMPAVVGGAMMRAERVHGSIDNAQRVPCHEAILEKKIPGGEGFFDRPVWLVTGCFYRDMQARSAGACSLSAAGAKLVALELARQVATALSVAPGAARQIATALSVALEVARRVVTALPVALEVARQVATALPVALGVARQISTALSGALGVARQVATALPVALEVARQMAMALSVALEVARQIAMAVSAALGLAWQIATALAGALEVVGKLRCLLRRHASSAGGADRAQDALNRNAPLLSGQPKARCAGHGSAHPRPPATPALAFLLLALDEVGAFASTGLLTSGGRACEIRLK